MSKTPSITISAHRDGYRRLGVAHSEAPRSWPAGHWNREEIEILRADPGLVVVDAGADVAADGKAPATPTVEAALADAVSALRQATPAEIRNFFKAVSDDSDLQVKIESAMNRTEALFTAIAGLDPENPDHFTKGGKPEVRALEKASGLTDITASERDGAWEDYRKAKDNQK